MRIIKVYNSESNRDTYKCTIGNETYYGTYDTVSAWKDYMMRNSDFYKEIKELNIEACKQFYK